MNRSSDQVMEALTFCVANGAIGAFLLGDNEAARLIMAYRGMRSTLEQISDLAAHASSSDLGAMAEQALELVLDINLAADKS